MSRTMRRHHGWARTVATEAVAKTFKLYRAGYRRNAPNPDAKRQPCYALDADGGRTLLETPGRYGLKATRRQRATVRAAKATYDGPVCSFCGGGHARKDC